MKKINEANDSWDGMLPVNINKNSIPKLDLQFQSTDAEEDMFRVFDIAAPRTIEMLGKILIATILTKTNLVSPLSVINDIRLEFNRIGYDFPLSEDRMTTLKSIGEGYVDFPLFKGTNPNYPYQIDQTYPGHRVMDDGIESKLGYKLILRIHVSPTTFMVDSQVINTKLVEGEIIPENS